MALFRKRLAPEEFSAAVSELFNSRLGIVFSEVSSSVSKKSGGETDSAFGEKERVEKIQFIWIFAAAHLSQLRQSGEARAVSSAMIEFMSFDKTHELEQEAKRIVYSFSNDSSLFHNVTYEIFRSNYPEFYNYISAYKSEVNGTHVISGIELASCLRGIDFLLKDYKLA